MTADLAALVKAHDESKAAGGVCHDGGRLPDMKSSVCVSTVSIVGGRDGGPPDRAREIVEKVVAAGIIGRLRPRLS